MSTAEEHQVPRARALTDDDVDAVVNHLVDRLSDKSTVEKITSAWSGVIDAAIGRGIRRLAGAVIFAVLILGAIKFDLLSRFLK